MIIELIASHNLVNFYTFLFFLFQSHLHKYFSLKHSYMSKLNEYTDYLIFVGKMSLDDVEKQLSQSKGSQIIIPKL